jgi:hypothetical protein
MKRKKLKGEALRKALQEGHEARMRMCAYGPYNDYKLCPDCGSVLAPAEACNCEE